MFLTEFGCVSYMIIKMKVSNLHKQQLRLMSEGTKILRNVGNYSDHSGNLKFRETVCFLLDRSWSLTGGSKRSRILDNE